MEHEDTGVGVRSFSNGIGHHLEDVYDLALLIHDLSCVADISSHDFVTSEVPWGLHGDLEDPQRGRGHFERLSDRLHGILGGHDRAVGFVRDLHLVNPVLFRQFAIG